MIEVQLPDGSVAEFPDGTAPDAMKAAIQKRFPPKSAPTATPANPYLADLPVPGGGPGYVAPGAAPAPVEKPFNETVFAQGTSGVNEGMANVAGFPVDATQGLLRLGAAGVNAVTGSDIQLPVDAIGGSNSIKAAIAPTIRPESSDPANQVVRRLGQEIGASIVPAGSVIAKSATPIRAAIGQAAVATGSGAAAGVAQQVSDNPYVELAAQILGGGGVAVVTAGGKKFVSPFEVSAERQAVNDTLAREGVEMTPGQMTGSKPLQYAESQYGGGAVADLTERQMEQFTEAALSRAGISAPRATPEVMSRAYDDLGDQFDALAVRNTITGDPQMVQDLGSTWSNYTANVNETARSPIIESTIRDIANAVRQNGGTISGDAYKSMRSRLGRSLKNSTDPELTDALRGLQGALDEAMERSMAAANSPDLGAWQQVRSDYKNYMILQNASAGAGENAAMGLISPAQLRTAATNFNKGQYVRGEGDFSELARAGVAGLTPLPNSGTAQRLSALGYSVPAAVGASLGTHVAGIPGGVAGFALGAAVPKVLTGAALSGPGRAYLTNQVARGGDPWEMLSGPAAGAGVNALAAQQQQGNALQLARARALN